MIISQLISLAIATLIYLNSIIINRQLNAKLPNFNEPLRNLTFGKINFLHTTDTHGWYIGHTNQKQYSSDWGDFISFYENLKNNHNDSDLLIIDTGDRHDGNGLSDLTSPNGLKSNDVFKNVDYDLITVGNHELYNADVSKLEYDTMVKHYGEKFVSTNVLYMDDDGNWVTFGNQYRYFQSNVNGYNILSFSFMFDFKMGNERVEVLPIMEIINEQWFIDILIDYSTNYPVDLIIIFGHLPVSHDWFEMYQLHSILRKYFPDTFIQYFGGHSHIRDFSIIDELSTGLQSGRYCETIGFLSIDDLKNTENITVDRKYIDFNLHSFMHHTNHNEIDKFNTDKGLMVSQKLFEYSEELNLNEVYGYVPQNYYMYAAEYYHKDKPDPKSLLRFLENSILPQLIPKICYDDNNSDNDKAEPPFLLNSTNNDRIILINTGGIRYDLYKGEFTKNSLFTVSPFKNKWNVIPNIPSEIAIKLQWILNSGDYILSNGIKLKNSHQLSIKEDNDYNINDNYINDNYINDNNINDIKLSYGYTTIDDKGNDGDDTIHRKIPVYKVPNVIQTYENNGNAYTDVVYYDFIQPFILKALSIACDGDKQLFKELITNVSLYNDCYNEFNLGELLKQFAIKNWQ